MKRIFSALFILFIGSFAFAQSAEKLGKICSGLEAELEEIKQMLKEEEERGNNVSS